MKKYFELPKQTVRNLATEFANLVTQVEEEFKSDKEFRYPTTGGCWLWLLNNRRNLTRALLAVNRVTVTKDGKYLVSLDEFSEARSLDQRQAMTQRLSQLVLEIFANRSTYFSAPESYDPESASFNSDVDVEDTDYFNRSWDA